MLLMLKASTLPVPSFCLHTTMADRERFPCHAADIGRHRQTSADYDCTVVPYVTDTVARAMHSLVEMRQTLADYDCTVVFDAGKTSDVT